MANDHKKITKVVVSSPSGNRLIKCRRQVRKRLLLTVSCAISSTRLPALVRRSEPQEILMPDNNAPASGFQYSVANLKPVEPEPKVALTFPDGARREFPKN